MVFAAMVDGSLGEIDVGGVNQQIASLVELPGDDYYGDLTLVRDAIKRGIDTALEDAEVTANSTRPAGMVDAMSLLPNALTHRITTRVQAGFDGELSRFTPANFTTTTGRARPDDLGELGAPRDGIVGGLFSMATVTLGPLGATLGARLDTYRLV